MAEVLSPSAVEAARERIRPHVRHTPHMTVEGAAFGLAEPVSLKLELFQHTGSFKTRGAFNNLLARPVPAVGVTAGRRQHAVGDRQVCAHFDAAQHARRSHWQRVRGWRAGEVGVFSAGGDGGEAQVGCARQLMDVVGTGREVRRAGRCRTESRWRRA